MTFRIETALAGIAGLESTRSLSRNGFSQVTAIFSEKTDIYFARQQVNERLIELRSSLPPGAEPRIGPVSTGLGEIYMWSISLVPKTGDSGSKSGWQNDGTFLTAEGERLTTEIERGAYLRTVQDWILRPQVRSVPGVAGVDAIGGYVKQYQVKPDPAKLISLGAFVQRCRERHRGQQYQPGRQHHRPQRRGHRGANPAAGSRPSPTSAMSPSSRAAQFQSGFAMSPTSQSAEKSGPAAPAATGAKSWSERP